MAVDTVVLPDLLNEPVDFFVTFLLFLDSNFELRGQICYHLAFGDKTADRGRLTDQGTRYILIFYLFLGYIDVKVVA